MKKLFIRLICLLAIPVAMIDAQTTAPVGGDAQGPAIVKLSDSDYPTIARNLSIRGTVHLQIDIDKDGKLKNAVAIDGPPILQDYSVQYAKNAVYSCSSCKAEHNLLQLTFQYDLENTGPCPDATSEEQILYQPTKITITNSNIEFLQIYGRCILSENIDPAYTKQRGIKCAYLWRCQWKKVRY